MKIIRKFDDTIFVASFMLLLVAFQGCKKLVQVNIPYTSTSASNVYSTDATATAVLTGIYTQLSSAPFNSAGIQSISLFGGMSADELTLYSGVTDPSYISCYKNALSGQSSTTMIDLWSNIYPYVFEANAAIEGITASNSLTPSIKQQLLGEAKFMRAFFYFYLINFYGDVPLVLSTDYTKTAIVPRVAKAQVYQQIIQDLKDAQSLLSSKYLDVTLLNTTAERTRPNTWVATALLARAYLYTSDWSNAEIQASLLINNKDLFGLNTLNNAFLKASLGNKEAIWQWQPVSTGFNTQDARLFVIPPTGLTTYTTNPVYLNSNLLNSFEPDDMRKIVWSDSVILNGTVYYYPYKYKINSLNSTVTSTAAMTEYTMVFRLAEQYLIRSEARAYLGNILNNGGSLSDLNLIRERAGLSDYLGAMDQQTVVRAILHERQVEFFTEWGHRWLDIKRAGLADSIMSIVTPQKGGSWNSNWQLYPISVAELKSNPDLIQNPGY